jgi:hypothetical protein
MEVGLLVEVKSGEINPHFFDNCVAQHVPDKARQLFSFVPDMPIVQQLS